MSVSALLDFENVAYDAQSVRCYNLRLDGHIYDAEGGHGTYLIGTIGITGAYANDSYTAGITNVAYSKFGYLVNLQLKQFQHTIVSSGGVFTFSTLPENIRPISEQKYIVIGVNNGTTVACTLKIATSGVMTLYYGVNPDVFAAGIGGLPVNTSVTYTIN